MMTTNNKIWDAKRLVNEYVQLSDCIDAAKDKSVELAWPNKIKVLRLASAISACLGIKLDTNNPLPVIELVFRPYNRNIRLLFNNSAVGKVFPITNSKYEEAMAIVKDILGKDFLEDKHNVVSDDGNFISRTYLVEKLLKFRILSYRLSRFGSGIIEGNASVYNTLRTVEMLYIEPMRVADEKLDTIIGLLLGTPFEQSFKEEDLIKRYKFPTETDDELQDWWFDNM